MLDASSRDEVLGVIAWMHTFSPAKMWIRGMEVLSKPLLYMATQANVEIPWDSIDMDFMNLNQAAHGDREYAYILTRLGVARITVVGHASNPKVVGRVASWVRAAAGWAASRHMKVVRFGDNMRNVAVTEGDKTEAERKIGVSSTPGASTTWLQPWRVSMKQMLTLWLRRTRNSMSSFPSCASEGSVTTPCATPLTRSS